MPDVFLSYASADANRAERLVRALEQVGLDIFWDQTTPPGADWDEWLRSKLSASSSVVVLWSRASVRSANVRHEAIIARDSAKLIPVMLEQLPADDFPMGLYLVQGIKLEHWNGDVHNTQFQKLLSEISAKQTNGPAEPIIRRPDTANRLKARRRLLFVMVAVIWALGTIGIVEFVGAPPSEPFPLSMRLCGDPPRDRSFDAWIEAQENTRPCTEAEIDEARRDHDQQVADFQISLRSYWSEVALMVAGVLLAPFALLLALWSVVQAARWLLRTAQAAR